MAIRGRADHLLFGRDFAVSTQLTAVAAVLFVVVFLARVPAVLGPLPGPGGAFDAAVHLAALAVATAGAYRNDGLLISVALAAALTLGFYLPYAFSELLRPHRSALLALGLGAGYAVLLGGLGFLLGAGIRRLVERART